MRSILPLLGSTLFLSACETVPTVSPTEEQYPAANVQAAFETPVMASVGDSTDDPAIWIGPGSAGFITGTDKQAGLYVYNLDGSEREFFPVGLVNNVDLRDGFQFEGRDHVLLVMSNDEINTIEMMLYDPAEDQFFRPDGASFQTGTLSPYGICLGRNQDGTFNAGITTKSGRYVQFSITTDGSQLTANRVRAFSTLIQTEGCVFDDRTEHLYLAQEEGNVLRYSSKTEEDDTPLVIAKAGEYGMLADLEGVTLYEQGTDGGYVLVSSQGNNSYVAFSLPNLEFAGRFRIADGAVDGVSTTDGIAAISTPTEQFPEGFFVAQDDMDETSPSEARKKQNFKIVDWREISTILK